EEPQVAEEPEMVEAVQEPREEKVGFFGRLKKGLKKTRQDFNYKINDILGNYVKIDEEMMEDLEDLLISADIGMETTMKLIDNLRDTIRDEQIQDPKEVKPLLAREMEAILNKNSEAQGLSIEPLPAIILVVGVNGVGKTTTIGKLAYRFQKEGRSVLIAAADTFRAAAIEQIKTWAERSNTPVIAHQEGSDPASVVYDGIQAAKSRGVDILICDTAGRLHNKKNLMNELEKINRVIQREYPEATKEHLLVLDATTGQNALLQAKTFHEATDLTGIVLTKLDGTAKGGVVLPLVDSMNLPIKLIGVGEGMEDLQDFSGADFARALLQEEG
ncbi:MAG: signal recognition particle-docking protein FtsY, partial [Tissierellia bacterium]|nr:signal recognition particle-docking protein FtsY [Tissierellia bacterium]